METRYHNTAGGVVVDDEGRILVLEREVVRDGATVHEVRLPKGHIDEGETPEQAALREVGEESGYWGIEIAADLGTARVSFTFKGAQHERDEHYFLMRLVSPERTGTRCEPGSEEALFTPAWLAPKEAAARLTYASERDFATRGSILKEKVSPATDAGGVD